VTDHEPAATSIAAIYVEVAQEYAAVPANGQQIIAETIKRVLAAQAEGRLIDEFPTHAELIGDWLNGTLSREASSNQKRFKKSLIAGQQSMDLGHYDQVLVVCGKATLKEQMGADTGEGRKTTLGLFNADDGVLLLAESRRNRNKVVAADDALHAEMLARTLPRLRRFPNWRAAHEAGEL
jgi:hypothetical protein